MASHTGMDDRGIPEDQQADPVLESQIPKAPPTTPGALGSRNTTWQTVIGTVSIVLGVMGLINGIWSIVGTIVMRMVLGGLAITQGGPNSQFDAATRPLQAWGTPLIVCHALLAGIAIILIIAGAKLHRRRPAARTWHVRWAIGKMLCGALVTVISCLMQIEQMTIMSQGTTPMPPAFAIATAAFSAVIGLVWLSAYPVFILVWFARRSVRNDMAAWPALSARRDVFQSAPSA